MTTPTLPATPDQFAPTFAENFNTGDLDRVVAAYAHDAVLNLGAGQVFAGRDVIRTPLANFLAPGLPIAVTPLSTTVSGDHAFVTFDWTITGSDPAGNPFALAGRASEVLRREPDGWRQLLDLPFSAATDAA